MMDIIIRHRCEIACKFSYVPVSISNFLRVQPTISSRIRKKEKKREEKKNSRSDFQFPSVLAITPPARPRIRTQDLRGQHNRWRNIPEGYLPLDCNAPSLPNTTAVYSEAQRKKRYRVQQKKRHSKKCLIKRKENLSNECFSLFFILSRAAKRSKEDQVRASLASRAQSVLIFILQRRANVN